MPSCAGILVKRYKYAIMFSMSGKTLESQIAALSGPGFQELSDEGRAAILKGLRLQALYSGGFGQTLESKLAALSGPGFEELSDEERQQRLNGRSA